MAVEHHRSGRLSEAGKVYQAVLELDPNQVDALHLLGVLSGQLGRHEQAIQLITRAIELQPRFIEAHNNLGNVMHELGRLDAAEACYRRALQLQPDFTDALNNLGMVLDEQGKSGEAETLYRQALRLQPDLFVTHHNLGITLRNKGRLREAIECFSHALVLRPQDGEVLSDLVHLKQLICDWSDLSELIDRCLAAVESGAGRLTPFTLLAMPSTPAQQFQCARRWGAGFSTADAYEHQPTGARQSGRIRLGYLSADFRNHAITYLTTQLFELHDRSRFEVIGFSYGPESDSEMRLRLTRAFDMFVDLRPYSHQDASRKIHDAGIDILIDLQGYTKNARTRILARRPAPIQVNFLGYPGTMGVDFIDYLVTDNFIIPPAQARFYSEKLVYLPDCYQPNDRKRAIAPDSPSRTDCALPEQAFVFCCFNNSYKITPDFFGVWMELLRKYPDSVLWLLEPSPLVRANLRREAEVRGVLAERLIFASREPLSQHLARHRLADLFLDTLPYGAHTTASDALWAGLPVLTCVGDTFAGRVGGSLLRAAGLPELITHSLEEYAARALALATTQRDELARLRMRLEQNRLRCSLFDSERFTRHLELAFEQMWARHREGLLPESFTVTPPPIT